MQTKQCNYTNNIVINYCTKNGKYKLANKIKFFLKYNFSKHHTNNYGSKTYNDSSLTHACICISLVLCNKRTRKTYKSIGNNKSDNSSHFGVDSFSL